MRVRVIRPFVDKQAGGRARHAGETAEVDGERAALLAAKGLVEPVGEAAAEDAAEAGAAGEAVPAGVAEDAAKPTAEDTKRAIMDWAMGRGVELSPKLTKAQMLDEIADL